MLTGYKVLALEIGRVMPEGTHFCTISAESALRMAAVKSADTAGPSLCKSSRTFRKVSACSALRCGERRCISNLRRWGRNLGSEIKTVTASLLTVSRPAPVSSAYSDHAAWYCGVGRDDARGGRPCRSREHLSAEMLPRAQRWGNCSSNQGSTDNGTLPSTDP